MKTPPISRAPLTAAILLLGGFCGAAERPNFLLIIADDLTWSDVGFAGSRQVRTPHLDRLAAEGMACTTMFTPATTCSPSRHALYTGLYCIRSGAYPNHTRVFEGTRSIFTHLKEVGYRVALQNKTHVGPPASFPYQHLPAAGDLDATREFLTADPDQPWLLVFASNDPHGPWTRGDRAAYPPDKLEVPPYLHDNAVTRDLLAAYYAEISALDDQVGALLRLLRQTGQEENTLVMFLSEQGSSFPYGGKWSVYDNGIRVAMAVRWPGRIAPGSETSALLQYVDVAPTLLEAAGVDPAGVDAGCPDALGDRGLDGRSFLAVLTGQQHSFRDVVFAQHTTVGINGYLEPYPMRAVRDTRYKLIRNLAPENTYTIGGIHRGQPLESWKKDAESNPRLAARIEWLYRRPAVELYDLQADPLEMNNLAGREDLTEVQDRLQRRLDAWMRQQGDQGLATENQARSRQARRRAEKNKAAESGQARPRNKRKKSAGR